MATYFVISDIHSFYNEMIQALNKAGYQKDNKNHVLISCGDLLDRGPDAIKCLEFINNIPDSNKICIKGNHEYLLEDIFDKQGFSKYDYHNGTVDTVYQLSESEDPFKAIEECANNSLLKQYLSSCIDYFETDKYIFVHGWIPCKQRGFDSKQFYYYDDWRNGSWFNAGWLCCFDAWAQGVKVPDKTIVAGHWHTSYGHSKYHHYGNEFEDEWIRVWNELYPHNKIKDTACFDIFRDDGIIAIDGCTVYSGKVNVLKIGKQKSLKKMEILK